MVSASSFSVKLVLVLACTSLCLAARHQHARSVSSQCSQRRDAKAGGHVLSRRQSNEVQLANAAVAVSDSEHQQWHPLSPARLAKRAAMKNKRHAGVKVAHRLRRQDQPGGAVQLRARMVGSHEKREAELKKRHIADARKRSADKQQTSQRLAVAKLQSQMKQQEEPVYDSYYEEVAEPERYRREDKPIATAEKTDAAPTEKKADANVAAGKPVVVAEKSSGVKTEKAAEVAAETPSSAAKTEGTAEKASAVVVDKTSEVALEKTEGKVDKIAETVVAAPQPIVTRNELNEATGEKSKRAAERMEESRMGDYDGEDYYDESDQEKRDVANMADMDVRGEGPGGDEEYNENASQDGAEAGKHWDQWGEWGDCSVSCGPGKSVRWRHCLGGPCQLGDKEAEVRPCDGEPCPPPVHASAPDNCITSLRGLSMC